jgi:hypothetical protein
MKDLEHNATPVTFQFVDVRSSMSARDCLTGGLEPQGLLRKSGRYGAKGEGWTAED